MTVERSSAPCAGLTHFFYGGTCVVCETKLACCRNCRSSYEGAKPGTIACGHGVNDEALREEDASQNPIWAVRKYSFRGLLAAMQGKVPEGSDDERMSPDDGRDCATFEPRDGL